MAAAAYATQHRPEVGQTTQRETSRASNPPTSSAGGQQPEQPANPASQPDQPDQPARPASQAARQDHPGQTSRSSPKSSGSCRSPKLSSVYKELIRNCNSSRQPPNSSSGSQQPGSLSQASPGFPGEAPRADSSGDETHEPGI